MATRPYHHQAQTSYRHSCARRPLFFLLTCLPVVFLRPCLSLLLSRFPPLHRRQQPFDLQVSLRLRLPRPPVLLLHCLSFRLLFLPLPSLHPHRLTRSTKNVPANTHRKQPFAQLLVKPLPLRPALLFQFCLHPRAAALLLTLARLSLLVRSLHPLVLLSLLRLLLPNNRPPLTSAQLPHLWPRAQVIVLFLQVFSSLCLVFLLSLLVLRMLCLCFVRPFCLSCFSLVLQPTRIFR